MFPEYLKTTKHKNKMKETEISENESNTIATSVKQNRATIDCTTGSDKVNKTMNIRVESRGHK